MLPVPGEGIAMGGYCRPLPRRGMPWVLLAPQSQYLSPPASSGDPIPQPPVGSQGCGVQIREEGEGVTPAPTTLPLLLSL